MYDHIMLFSKRVTYYGKVLDVMVQHHPEYVSLAWGSLKLVFGVVIEHERLGSTIIAGLNDIGEALSRIDLAQALYPTEKMRDTIVTLNCFVISFPCRALDWYNASSLSRAVQSFTRPAALRYDDLVGDIKKSLAKVTDPSIAGGQAEQRDMHEMMRKEYHMQQDFRSSVRKRLDEMEYQLHTLARQKYSDGDFNAVHQQIEDVTSLLRHVSKTQTSMEQTLLQELLLMKQDLQATQADLRIQISEVQFNQALSFLSDRCSIDYQVAYEQASLQLRAHQAISGKCAPFWTSYHFQLWDHSETCHIIVIKATIRNRLKVCSFYVSAIDQLIKPHVPVFWLIQQRVHRTQKDPKYGIFEVLRSLTVQTLRAILMQTDGGLTFRIRDFDAAKSIEDYTSLLVHNLSHLKLANLLVDANAISYESIEDCYKLLLNIPKLLLAQNKDSVIKIMLLHHEPPRNAPDVDRRQTDIDRGQAIIVQIAQTSKRKSRRVPQFPLRGSTIRPMTLR